MLEELMLEYSNAKKKKKSLDNKMSLVLSYKVRKATDQIWAGLLKGNLITGPGL